MTFVMFARARWTDLVVHGAKPAKITGWLVVEHRGVQLLWWARFVPYWGRKRAKEKKKTMQDHAYAPLVALCLDTLSLRAFFVRLCNHAFFDDALFVTDEQLDEALGLTLGKSTGRLLFHTLRRSLAHFLPPPVLLLEEHHHKPGDGDAETGRWRSTRASSNITGSSSSSNHNSCTRLGTIRVFLFSKFFVVLECRNGVQLHLLFFLRFLAMTLFE